MKLPCLWVQLRVRAIRGVAGKTASLSLSHPPLLTLRIDNPDPFLFPSFCFIPPATRSLPIVPSFFFPLARACGVLHASDTPICHSSSGGGATQTPALEHAEEAERWRNGSLGGLASLIDPEVNRY